MKLTIRVLAVFALVVLSSCATFASHIITGTVRPPIDPALVKLYTFPPPKSKAIAILTVESSGWTTQGEKDIAVAKLKEEAASLGANGVLLTGMGIESSGVVGNMNPQTGAIWMGQSTYTTMRATAIFAGRNKKPHIAVEWTPWDIAALRGWVRSRRRSPQRSAS